MHKTENKSLWKDEVSYGGDTWYMGRIFEVKTSGASQTVGDSRTGPCNPDPTRVMGHILLKPGISPVRGQENGLGRERGSFLSVRV